MYEVSAKYKMAIKKDIVQTRLTIDIDGTEYGEEYLLAGSFRISNQCTNTADVTLGSVYIGELSATFRGIPIERNRWKGKVIKPSFYLLVGNDEWEEVPLGVFTVMDATHSNVGVNVKAYDDMRLFDKNTTVSQSGGKLYDFLVNACEACHVEMAQTEAELDLLPNGTQELVFFGDNDVQTWRDLLSWVAQTYGGFATINRAGKLEIRTYTQTEVDSLSPRERHNGGSFSDYITKYTGISYLDLAAKSTRYTGAVVDDGTSLNLGGNPFTQSEAQAETVVGNLLTAIANIQYTPFKINTISNPAYDLGDVIEFTGGLAGGDCKCCLMQYAFVFRQYFSMAGYGADPDKATAKSKVDKNLSGLLAETNAGEMAFYEYRNQKQITIPNSALKQVLRLKLASKGETRVQIHININLLTEAAENEDYTHLTAEYMVNGDIITLKPKETYVDGFHVLHLMYILPMVANTTTYFVLRLSAENGSIEIDRQGIWLFASGLGLVGDGTWDGTFDFYEEATRYDITEQQFKTDGESVVVAVVAILQVVGSDTATEWNISESTMESASDSIRILMRYMATPRELEDESGLGDAEGRVLEDESGLGDAEGRTTEEEVG